MVTQDDIRDIKTKAVGEKCSEVLAYVLKMLAELATMADMSDHTKLASDIEAVLDDHSD